MLGLLRKFGGIGALAAAARTPVGQRVITKAKAYINDPATRSKIADLRGKITPKTTR